MDRERLLDSYKKMRRIRFVEEYIASIYNDQPRPMHTAIHLYTGEEAIAVGVCNNLKKDDIVFSTHRNHGHYLAKGGNLQTMIAELYGKRMGCCHGKGASMHLCDMGVGVAPSSAIVAGNVSIATGYALSMKLRKSSNIAVSFCGDGATEEGSVYESISFAAVRKLPILFVVENNLYAINTPLDVREPNIDLSKKFENIIETHVGDGNDITVTDEIAKKAVEKIYSGNGPQLVIFDTYRWHGHDGIGDGSNYRFRTSEEIERWKKKDPLIVCLNMINDSSFSNSITAYESVLSEEMSEAIAFAEKSDFPSADELYTDFI